MPTNRLHCLDEKHETLRAALSEADKGRFVSQEAMDAWVLSWNTDAEAPPPEVDLTGIRLLVHGQTSSSSSRPASNSRPVPRSQ